MRREQRNPPNRFEERRLELLEPAPEVQLEITEVEARQVLSDNRSPDIPFRYSLNPYQGCYHGCVYCYARPSHQYLGLGAGTDFERRLQVKMNAPALLARRFESRAWTGEVIVFSGNTDCYQPLEARYELTRACLRLCLAYRNPVQIITKGGVIMRDVELLAELSRRASVQVWVSLPFGEPGTSRAMEPYAAPPARRLEVIEALASADVPVGVAIAPVIPGLNDAEVAPLLERAAARGAGRAFMTLLRLPGEVEHVFTEQLREAFPMRVDRVMAALSEMRDGKLGGSPFGERMQGRGARWQIIEQVFQKTCARLGMHAGEGPVPSAQAPGFRRPRPQLGLFDQD